MREFVILLLKFIHPGAMRLPRRVPWAHIGELEQVCSWIYAEEEDLGTKTLAINRVSPTYDIAPV